MEFEGNISYSVKPCDVDIIGRYPGLGLSFESIDKIEQTIPFNVAELPIRVCIIIQSDHLGGDVINQYTLVLANVTNVVIRHVYPPMSIGIRIE